MSARLIHENLVPHGGPFRIVDPLTKVECVGTTFEQLYDAVVRQRKANSQPVGIELRQELEKWVCADWPRECENHDPNAPRNRRLTMADVVHGTTVLASVVMEWGKHLIGMAEHPLVSQEEANTRAEACSKCQFNVTFPKPCSGLCPELAVLVNAIKGGRKTPYDSDLKSCGICGCMTQAHVWPRLDLLARGVNDQQKQQFKAVPGCWKQIQ